MSEAYFAANTFVTDDCVGCPANQALADKDEEIPSGAPIEVIEAYDDQIAGDSRDNYVIPEDEAREAWLTAIEIIEERVEEMKPTNSAKAEILETDLERAREVAAELGWDDE